MVVISIDPSSYKEAGSRLREALPEVDIKKLGERISPTSGHSMLEERWERLILDFQYWIEMSRTYS